MRTNLKLFRVKNKMTQEQFAAKLGFSRSAYASVETGQRNGKQAFWQRLQDVFNVGDGEMWELIKNDKD